MKQKIDPKDIRKGDLVRYESEDTRYRTQAVEYKAVCDRDAHRNDSGSHYLLERPEPPFEPYWGMVIGDKNDNSQRAVYLPSGEDVYPWLTSGGISWLGDDWAKRKLAEGWVVIEKPGAVK